MRLRQRSPQQIKQLLVQQTSSGLSVAEFCRQNKLNAGTFYAWRVKYSDREVEPATGFRQLVAAAVALTPSTTLHLPGGARLELTDWSVADIARLTRALTSATDA